MLFKLKYLTATWVLVIIELFLNVFKQTYTSTQQ